MYTKGVFEMILLCKKSEYCPILSHDCARLLWHFYDKVYMEFCIAGLLRPFFGKGRESVMKRSRNNGGILA